jgi:hypothetical protein
MRLLFSIAVLALTVVVVGLVGLVGLALHFAFRAWRGEAIVNRPLCAYCGQPLRWTGQWQSRLGAARASVGGSRWLPRGADRRA